MPEAGVAAGLGARTPSIADSDAAGQSLQPEMDTAFCLMQWTCGGSLPGCCARVWAGVGMQGS